MSSRPRIEDSETMVLMKAQMSAVGGQEEIFCLIRALPGFDRERTWPPTSIGGCRIGVFLPMRRSNTETSKFRLAGGAIPCIT